MCEIFKEEWLTEEGSVKRVKREHLVQKEQKDDESVGSFNPLWTKRGHGIAQAVLHVVPSHDGTPKQQYSEGGRTGSWGNSNPKDNTFVLPLLIIFRKGLLIALKKLTPFKSQSYKILGECISIRKWRIYNKHWKPKEAFGYSFLPIRLAITSSEVLNGFRAQE